MSAVTRRAFLTGLGAALAMNGSQARAGERLIERLIARAQDHPTASLRIELISRALLGHRYRANTLIGGPRKPEVFVTRDDVFDCVTFCETVLAAARAHDLPSFEAELRAVRYHNGVVDWRERNHDFAAWCERNVAGRVCRTVTVGAEPVEVRKVLETPRALGRRNYAIAATPAATLIAQRDRLRGGDIIGFVSRRPWLDYFHIGFVMFDSKGALLLRHASRSRGRVIDQPMKRFLAANGVRYVTVARPQNPERIS